MIIFQAPGAEAVPGELEAIAAFVVPPGPYPSQYGEAGAYILLTHVSIDP